MTSWLENRLPRLRGQLAGQECEAMILMHPRSLRYLVGFTGSAGVLVVTPEDATLYVDGRYTEQAQRQAVGAQALEAPRPVLPYVLGQVQSRLGRLGFEANHVTFAEYQVLSDNLCDTPLVGLNGVVERLRAIKDEGELALMRRSIEITDQVFESFCGWLEPGMVEDHVAARLEYEQRMAGGELNASGVTIVASGPRTSMPHGVASERIIGENEPVMIDIGTTVGAYCSDLTRTVHLGKASEEFKAIYQTVYDAQQRALDGIRAGMTGIEADALAREVIETAGHGDRFGHSLGHSLGLDVHERPFLNARDSTVLEENMVFTVEPGIYLPGWGGVRIEDVVRVTADGCEVLSKAPRNLLEL